MRRRFLVLLALLVPLFLTQAASPAVKDFGAKINVAPSGNGQFLATIQNEDTDATLDSFVFVPGPQLKITGVVSSDAGSCGITGATFTCTGLGLAAAQCTCVLGGIVDVTFTGTGNDSAGASTIAQVGSPQALAAITPPVTPATTATASKTPVTTTTTAKTTTTVKKATPACKTGQKSTKAKPCVAKTVKKTVKKVTIAVCKKGQHSTKKHPCRVKKK